MTHCTRCGRRLKAPTPTGLGPTCERYVLGSKPKRQPAVLLRRIGVEAALRGDDE